MGTTLTTQPHTSSIVSRLRDRRASQAVAVQSPEILALRNQYPSVKHIIAEYSPTFQDTLLEEGADYDFLAQQDDIPTLGMVVSAYGIDNAATFLLTHIHQVNLFSGTKEKMQPYQMESLARTIISEYGWLNIAEICFFFALFRLGKFEALYGSVDPMKVTKSLNMYVTERNRAVERHNATRIANNVGFDFDSNLANAKGYDEYREMLRKGAEGDEEAQAALRLTKEECFELLTDKRNKPIVRPIK